MENDFKPKYYGSMVRVSVTTVKGGIEYTIHLEDVEAIPIEWILKWACEFIDPNSEGYKMAMELVHDWRKENEENI